MKKLLLIPTIMFLLSFSLVFAGTPLVVYGDITSEVLSDGRVQVNIELANVGLATAPNFLVELQPLGTGESFFTIISPQRTCDASYPDNVHRVVSGLPATESVYISLITTPLQTGTYTLKLVSTDYCCTVNPNCKAVDPFFWGTNVGKIEVKSSVVPYCGNGKCEANENANSCSQDCKPYLGDGVCSTGEKYPDEPICPQERDDDITDNITDISTWSLSLPILLIIIGTVLLIFKRGKK